MFFSLPQDMIKQILCFIDLNDIVSVQQVSKALKELSLDNRIWQAQLRKNYGIETNLNDECRDKFLLIYLFEKGKLYLDKATRDNVETLVGKATDCFTQVLSLLNKMSEKGISNKDYAWTSNIYGEIYCQGYGVDADINKGVTFIMDAANAGDRNAMFFLARIYFNDVLGLFNAFEFNAFECLPKDLAKGKSWLLKSHVLGNTAATLYLARLYSDGENELGFEKNIHESINLLTVIANKGCGKAAYELAKIYVGLKSDEVADYLPRNLTEVEKEFDAFAEKIDVVEEIDDKDQFLSTIHDFALKGVIKAMQYLHEIYSDECNLLNVAVNKTKANYYLELIKKYKTPELRCDKALFWVEKALAAGNKEAATEFPSMLLRFESIVERDEESALKDELDINKIIQCLKTAVSLNSSYAAYVLGCIYAMDNFKGLYNSAVFEKKDSSCLGVPHNIKEAIQWFEQGANLKSNHVYSRLCAQVLANFFQLNQFGIKPELEKVIYWYEKDIELGDPWSLITLGSLFLNGDKTLGLTSNPDQAEIYFNKIFHYPELRGRGCCIIADKYYLHGNWNEFIKWNIRGMMGHVDRKDCWDNLINFFKEIKKYDRVVMDFKEMYRTHWSESFLRNDPSNDELLNLAKLCYKALDLPILQDEFLLNQNDKPKLGFLR